MFHAGVVTPSSTFLLQLLTAPDNDFVSPLTGEFVEYESRLGLIRPPAADAAVEGIELVVLVLLAPLGRPYDVALEPYPPVLCGLIIPALLLGPIALANLLGCIAFAFLLNALMQVST